MSYKYLYMVRKYVIHDSSEKWGIDVGYSTDLPTAIAFARRAYEEMGENSDKVTSIYIAKFMLDAYEPPIVDSLSNDSYLLYHVNDDRVLCEQEDEFDRLLREN